MTLQNKIDNFLFGAEAISWLKIFRFLLYPYLIFLCWNYNWSAYSSMSGLFVAPGIFASLQIPFPPLYVIRFLQIWLTLSAFFVGSQPWGRLAAASVFMISLVLDFLHNGFGFVNAQIHVIWFAGILLFAHGSDLKARASFCYRFCELVVVMAYIQSGFNKLRIGGLSWMSQGTTLQIALLRQHKAAGQYLAEFSRLMPALASLSVLLELSFLLYYFAPKLRKSLLFAAVSFHIGTFIFLGIDFFHLWIFATSLIILDIIQFSRKESLCLKQKPLLS